MHNEPKYWFPAKRYGWGWGIPTSWQGVLVLLAYGGLLALGSGWLVKTHENGSFALYAGALTALLVFVCWLKGEPPRSRSGRQD